MVSLVLGGWFCLWILMKEVVCDGFDDDGCDVEEYGVDV